MGLAGWIGNTPAVFIALILAFVACWLLFWSIRSESLARNARIVAIFLGGSTVLGIALGAEQKAATFRVSNLEWSLAVSDREYLFLIDAVSGSVCRPYQLSDQADQIAIQRERERELACEILEEWQVEVESSVLSLSDYADRSRLVELREDFLSNQLRSIVDQADRSRAIRTEISDYQQRSRESHWSLTVTFLSPYLAAIAMAIALALEMTHHRRQQRLEA